MRFHSGHWRRGCRHDLEIQQNIFGRSDIGIGTVVCRECDGGPAHQYRRHVDDVRQSKHRDFRRQQSRRARHLQTHPRHAVGLAGKWLVLPGRWPTALHQEECGGSDQNIRRHCRGSSRRITGSDRWNLCLRLCADPSIRVLQLFSFEVTQRRGAEQYLPGPALPVFWQCSK